MQIFVKTLTGEQRSTALCERGVLTLLPHIARRQDHHAGGGVLGHH